jgi:methylated-DNA-protein-cysteine methyltransferase-like protein
MIKAIPRGRVATYAQIASLSGNYRAARQVARVLHSSSEKERLPWHRVINSRGGISLRPGRGFEEQKRLLKKEGVPSDPSGRVDLEKYLWEPASAPSRNALEFFRDLTGDGQSRRPPRRGPAGPSLKIRRRPPGSAGMADR